MKLVIDIGNTNIKFGLFDNHIIKQLIIKPTKQYKLIPKFKNIDECVIGSVVPKITNLISNDIYKKYHIKPKIININDFINLFNLDKFNKKEMGLDILAFALAIKNKHKQGIGISFGTATFAIAVKDNNLYGAIIAPSFDNALLSLTKTTALIKKANVNDISFNLGTNTITALSSGMAHSVNGFINSVVVYCKKNYGIDNVYVSGGKRG
jgi:type III pantothenate kinase